MTDTLTPRASTVRAVIRPATQPDLERIAEIYAHYVRESCITFDEVVPDSSHWQSKLAAARDAERPFLVAETPEGTVAGYAYVEPWKAKRAYRHTVENSIYLDPALTGRGLGTDLLTALLERSRAAGIAQVVAVVSDTGAEASLALHERFGFRRVGRLENVGFKFGSWIGVHLLQRSLE
ncbi:GNAT family N-acetyltransferase [Paramicrobacterium humi]|uniref:GNAT family N-acetyltransferase n=1 Tax=Paramicrobacterium humi TaxID=640635 RepID=UPI001FDF44C6|nr:GNAT family N-acetyltransferase [Microbacterium humi]